MKIACLSGKGGAGKTFAAVNLAAAAGECCYVDCDVEEPNGRLFLKPEGLEAFSVSTLLPDFDASLCTGCKKCVGFCRFHALVYIKDKPMVFSELCHSCGGCALVCPAGAVREKPRPVGILEKGRHGDITVITGVLNPGEASGTPLIRRAIKEAAGLSILDCPPGSACPVMESAMEAVRAGKEPELSTREKHTRLCYVVAKVVVWDAIKHCYLLVTRIWHILCMILTATYSHIHCCVAKLQSHSLNSQ